MAIALNQISFKNIDLVEVASTSAGRDYGRRFQLKDTHEELKFKELFRKAQKLTRQASSPDELAKVKSFIGKLVTVETAAILEYENRDDCMYKFRSWFHRLFGGAFFGSHLDRLESLATKVENKNYKILNEWKNEILDNLPSFERLLNGGMNIVVEDQTYAVSWNSPTLSIGDHVIQINEETPLVIPDAILPVFHEILNAMQNKEKESKLLIEQVTLLHSLGTQSIEVSGETFQIITSQNPCAVTIGALELSLPEGGACCIKYEGVEGDFPASFIPVFHEILSETYKQSSMYEYGNVNVSRAGLLHIPEWHLAKFCNLIHQFEYFSVSYQNEMGSDVGGVARDYITTLTNALQEQTSLFSEVDGNLKIPRIIRETDELIPACSQDESQTYENLGKLFAHCYFTTQGEEGELDLSTLSTGRYFTDALFKAILTLTKEEKDVPFADLDKKTHANLAKVILQHLDLEDTPTIKNMIQGLNLLSLSSETLGEYFQENNPILMTAASFNGMDAHWDEDGALAINQVTFIDDLYQAIFSNSHVKELKGISLGSMMGPIHAIAVGFASNNKVGVWNVFRKRDPGAISNKVQGSVDREDIISHLDSAWDSIISLKAQWLIEWLRDEENGATEAEVKQFLKYVTGGASLPEGKTITIAVAVGSNPYPKACTCGLILNLSNKIEYAGWTKDHWDAHKDSFIRNLKSAIKTEGTQMG